MQIFTLSPITILHHISYQYRQQRTPHSNRPENFVSPSKSFITRKYWFLHVEKYHIEWIKYLISSFEESILERNNFKMKIVLCSVLVPSSCSWSFTIQSAVWFEKLTMGFSVLWWKETWSRKTKNEQSRIFLLFLFNVLRTLAYIITADIFTWCTQSYWFL